MSTLRHVIPDRAPALATLAQECKGCPGTLCKGCHGTEHEGGCPYVFASPKIRSVQRGLRRGGGIGSLPFRAGDSGGGAPTAKSADQQSARIFHVPAGWCARGH